MARDSGLCPERVELLLTKMKRPRAGVQEGCSAHFTCEEEIEAKSHELPEVTEPAGQAGILSRPSDFTAGLLPLHGARCVAPSPALAELPTGATWCGCAGDGGLLP